MNMKTENNTMKSEDLQLRDSIKVYFSSNSDSNLIFTLEAEGIEQVEKVNSLVNWLDNYRVTHPDKEFTLVPTENSVSYSLPKPLFYAVIKKYYRIFNISQKIKRFTC